MYSRKIKSIINKAKSRGIGAIPVGLRVAFGGVKIFVEAQYEISGNVVVNLIDKANNTVAKIDGSESGKKLANSKLLKYVTKDVEWSYGNEAREKKYYASIVSKFINELDKEVNVANGKGKFPVNRNMAIKNRVVKNKSSSKKSSPAPRKKVVAKKPVKAKKAKTPAKKKSTPAGNAYKYVYSKKKGQLVYAGTIKK
jgi:hypothetical protein